ncbi:MAG: hypothetical protein KAR51_02980, partial [Candidatus Aenigmarchaeota archaeon]|nr:hypothetical protein [Candidatus Aenigmarchaeota archaeon]
MSISEGQLRISDLIGLIKSVYVPSFMEYYNTDSDVKVSSVYAEEGIPLEISSKEPFHKNVSGIFKDRINYLSGMLSGNNGNNGRKLIFLDDYKKNIDYDALESLLESFNPQRSLDTLGFD